MMPTSPAMQEVEATSMAMRQISCMIGREIVGVKMDDRGIGDSQRRDVACPNRKCLHLDFLLCAPYAANNANPNLLQLLFRMAKWGRTRKTKEP